MSRDMKINSGSAHIGGEALSIRPLDELTAIYHRKSGITHLVTDPVPQILEAMANGAGTVEEILAALRERYELGDVAPGDGEGEGGAEAIIAARLDELAELGLIEPRGAGPAHA